MTTLAPSAKVPLVVVHDRAQAEATADFVAKHGRPLVIVFAPSVALAGGPALARAMIPERPPEGASFALDFGNDPGAALRALEVGWTRESLIEPGRSVINLEGQADATAALDRALP